jgi:ATP phosphoribosyltransferase regulatory subunit
VSVTASSPSSGRLRAFLEAAGARWIELPILHPADPFLETAGEDIRRRMFVTEARSGERLALRPDFTIPVCLQHLKSGAAGARYAYEGPVFRRHEDRASERQETGYEDIGRADWSAADAEAIALAIAGVAAVASGPLQVRVGDIGVFAALLLALKLPGRWRRRLRRSFGLTEAMDADLDRMADPAQAEAWRLDDDVRGAAERGDREALAAILEDRLVAQGGQPGAGRSPAEIVERFFERRAIPDASNAAAAAQTLRRFLALRSPLSDAPQLLRGFAADHQLELHEAISRFAGRAEAIAHLARRATIGFDAGFGRPLDYYTGLVFEIRAGAEERPVAGGGRYDRLMEMLGARERVPAVGFAIRLDTDTESAGR